MRIRQTCFGLIMAALAQSTAVQAQDAADQVYLSSPKFTSAELTRADVEAALTSGNGHADFARKSLNGLDLSNLDLSGANFRAARLNKANFSNSKLDGATLDQAFAWEADFSGTSLRNAKLFAS